MVLCYSKAVRKIVRLIIFFHRDEWRDRPLVFSAAPSRLSSIPQNNMAVKFSFFKDSTGWRNTKCCKIQSIMMIFFRSIPVESKKTMKFCLILFWEIKNIVFETSEKTRGQLVPPSLWKKNMSVTSWFLKSALGRPLRRIFRTAFGRFSVWKWQNWWKLYLMVLVGSSDWNTTVNARNSI